MGTVSQKLLYTTKAVDDIQKALEEKGFDMTTVELSKYGNLIRLIKDSSSSGGESSSDYKQLINNIDNAVILSKENIYVNINNVISSAVISSKENIYVNINNVISSAVISSAVISSKENIYVNINNIIKQEE